MLDLSLRATPETRDVLDVSLHDLQGEYGWKRTLPINASDGTITVPNYHEALAYLESGSEDTASVRAKGEHYTPSVSHPIVEEWAQYFRKSDDSFHAVHPDRTVRRREQNYPTVYPRMRLSMQELIDMDFTEAGFSINEQFYTLVDEEGTGYPTLLSSVVLYSPTLPEDHQYTPLQASYLLMNSNSNLFAAFYRGGVTFRELLAVLPRRDEMSSFLPPVWSKPEEETARAINRFAEVTIALRGTVSTEELLGWTAKVYTLDISLKKIRDLTREIPKENIFAYIEAGATTYEIIRSLYEGGVDPSLAESFLKD